MKPIKLLFFLTSPVRGGVEEVVLGLLQHLDPSEFDRALAAPRPLLDSLASDLDGFGVEMVPVHAEGWRDAHEIGHLATFMRRWRPHVVNAHLFRSTAVAAPLARWCGIKAVVETYHGREGWRRGFLRGSFAPDRAVSRLVDRVIAVSEAAGAFLVCGKGYPAAKVVVIPNGRDLSVFRPGDHRESGRKELGLDQSVPIVGVVGRLEAQKGHAYLLAAWPAVLKEFPDARLLLVGDGSLREDLEQQARVLGISEQVLFLGFRPDVQRILDTIDVMALPSLYEGMPLTVIEGSAMARPVVATAVDGTPEVIRDGVTGYLVPPADPAALARALVTLLGDSERASAMGRAGREHVLSRFDVMTHVDATARVYRSVAA